MSPANVDDELVSCLNESLDSIASESLSTDALVGGRGGGGGGNMFCKESTEVISSWSIGLMYSYIELPVSST